jgi:hypothetical protein
MKQGQYKGNFNTGDTQFDVQLPVISFIDDNTHIIYCPALDLSGYGNDETEAKESFDIVLEEFLTYTASKKSLWADLKKLGWAVKKSNQKAATPPSISKLLDTNQEFNRIFNNFPFKKYNTGISLPLSA